MPLVLTLHRARDPVDRQRESRTLDEGTLTIGRGTGNTWVLQDPAQHLSKTHCIVSATRGGYMLTDCSSNGVFLNGAKQRMPRDSQSPLNNGDEFVIGDYLIQARIVADLSSRAVAAVAAASTPRGSPPAIERDDPFGLDEFLAPRHEPPAPTPPPAAAPPSFDPFADPARAHRDDPFGSADDDLLGSSPPAHLPFNEPGRGPAHPPAPDPFAPRAPSVAARAPRNDDPFGGDDDLFQGATPPVQWQGPSQPDHADAVNHAYIAPKAITPASADDWDDLLGDTPPGAPISAPPPPAPPPPPAAAPPPPAPPPVPAAVAPPPPPPADSANLIAAFLDGAGVPTLDVSKQNPEEYMRAAGALFGLMVESLRDVLMSRAAVKSEFGLEQTMLRPRENNALKFSITPQDAIAALLQPGRPGYMEPLRATREAFDDVRVYQLASPVAFEAAQFFPLYNGDAVLLKDDLVKRDEVLLAPGQSKTLALTPTDKVKAIGVIGAYRDYETLTWRTVTPVPPNQSSVLTVTSSMAGLSATIAPAK